MDVDRTATVRRADARDAAFLAEMTVAAADWRPGRPRRTVAEVMHEPSVWRYVSGWPRTGDVGVVAETDRPVGAAWWRFFTADDPGYGFVDSAVPEVSIGVRDGFRRLGIGERMMRTLMDYARVEGLTALSLSVERDNGAVGLYQRLGFEVVGHSGGSLTMLLPVIA